MEDLKKYAAGHRHFSFRGLLTAQSSKVEVIVTFLAILELMKMGTIRISQEHILMISRLIRKLQHRLSCIAGWTENMEEKNTRQL